MNKITRKEVSQNLSNYLQRAQAGENFVIFQANPPNANIISAKYEGILEAFDGFRDRIVAQGIDLDGDDIFASVRDDTPTDRGERRE